MLVIMMPISIAGRGVREVTMTVAFGYAGLAQADGTVASILFGAVYFIVGALGGLVWILSAEKAAGKWLWLTQKSKLRRRCWRVHQASC